MVSPHSWSLPGAREGTREQRRITKLFHAHTPPGYHPTCHRPPDVILTFEVPNQEAGDEGDEQENDDHYGDDHPPLWAALLHLLGVHGREELHAFLQVVHVLGEERRQEGRKADPKAWFGEVQPQNSLERSYLSAAAPQHREHEACLGVGGSTATPRQDKP